MPYERAGDLLEQTGDVRTAIVMAKTGASIAEARKLLRKLRADASPKPCAAPVREVSMDKFVIQGGHRLEGEISVGGAKNSALPVLAACLLTDEPVTLHRIPRVRDIRTMQRLLVDIGAETEHAEVHPARGGTADSLAGGALRAGEDDARVEPGAGSRWWPAPGGARFAAGRLRHRRTAHQPAHPGPGATGRAHRADPRLHRSRPRRTACAARMVRFDRITVTGTEDLLMAAVLARGETVLENAAREPEVADLAALLTKMGARIEGAGTSTIRIQGVERLHGADHTIIPDRIEAGTFLIAGAITGGDLTSPAASRSTWPRSSTRLQQAGVQVQPAGARHPARPPPAALALRRHRPPQSTRASPPICRPSTWR